MLTSTLVLVLLVSCSSDPTGPVLPQALVGTWTAEKMIVQSVDDPEVQGDVIAAGATFVLQIEENGSYTATLTVNEDPSVQRGRMEVDGSTITLDPEDDPPQEGTWSLSDGRLVIDGETAFDFDRNGTLESAYLHLELIRA